MSEAKYKKLVTQYRRSQKKKAAARFYNLNSILGNDWAIFYVICGGRMTGKSYSLSEYLCGRYKKRRQLCKNYWFRISETSTKALLANNANKLVDPDLVRKYNLDLTTKGNEVYYVTKRSEPDKDGKTRILEKELFMTVCPLSQFGKQKGIAYFDKDFEGEYNIVLDEFQLEQGEKRTSFDILYNFIGMCENIARTTKKNIRIFLVGNTLEEASTILKAFNFLPEKFGRFYLRSKKCVIDNLEPTEEYINDRKGSVADILGGGDMSNYTNELKKDMSMITKERTYKPIAIIKFTKEKVNWYTIWDKNIIKRYNNEKLDEGLIFNMRPYLGNYYSMERKQIIIDKYDAKFFKFNNLITQSYFTGDLALLRKS